MTDMDRIAWRQQLREEAMSTVMPADDPPGSYEDYRRTFSVLKGKGVTLPRALELTVLAKDRIAKLSDEEIVMTAREIYDND